MRSLLALVVAITGCGDNWKPAQQADAPIDDPVAMSCTPLHGTALTSRPVGQADGIATHVTAPPGDPRLFLVMREGSIRIFKNEVLVQAPFIDLQSLIDLTQTTERGLLGAAFHPDYAHTGLFFVYYTTAQYGTLARCNVSANDPDRADPTCTVILEVLHNSAGNHNGGMLEFGPDGYLYISTGDGGGAGDPNKRSQNPDDLLGKILRIDVDHPTPGLAYGIPPDNPYAHGGGRPEVYIIGARNPWRFAFDRGTGDLWIGDVGQNRTEEMDVLRPAQQNGANLGWSVYEGTGCRATQDDNCLEVNPLPCDPSGITFPRDERNRTTAHGSGWQAIIGGQSYYGTCYPDLVGYHFYADAYKWTLVKARLLPDDTFEMTEYPSVLNDGISSIYNDARGELYMSATSGMVYHLEAGP
jgi:glucose/arabinose dehydrogenase